VVTLCTDDESLEFEELRAYDLASGMVLLAHRFILGTSLDSIASARTFPTRTTAGRTNAIENPKSIEKGTIAVREGEYEMGR